LGIVTPTDEFIFFRGVGQPPTRNGGSTCILMDKKGSIFNGSSNIQHVQFFPIEFMGYFS
jgi:hypothetical protein